MKIHICNIQWNMVVPLHLAARREREENKRGEATHHDGGGGWRGAEPNEFDNSDEGFLHQQMPYIAQS